LTQRTRIVNKSPAFGFPPLVIKRDLAASRAARLRQAFLSMNEDDQGRMLLDKLNLDAFVPGKDTAYESIAELVRVLEASGETR
jgi:phosphonate transport system substrate-binding protein